MIRKNTTFLIYIFLSLFITINFSFAKENRKLLNGVSVAMNIHDKTPHGMPQQRINKDVLVRYFKQQLKEYLQKTPYPIFFRPVDPRLNITITVKGDRQSRKYYLSTKASLDEAMEEWQIEYSDYWDKEKNIDLVKKTEKYIEEVTEIVALGNQVVGWGSLSSEVENINRKNVDEWKQELADAKKVLVQAKEFASISGTIKQSLNSVASEFAKYYQLVKQHEQEYTEQATEIEKLSKQLGSISDTSSPRNEKKVYTETRQQSSGNILYETGSMISLHNHSDTAVAIYKDETLGYITKLLTNEIKATVIDYRSISGKPLVYKVRINLKDGSEYTGWIPEGVIKK